MDQITLTPFFGVPQPIRDAGDFKPPNVLFL